MISNPMAGELTVPLSDAKIVGENISLETYMRQDPGVFRGDPEWVMSRGELMEFAHCPQRWIDGVESDETKATEWGALIDCLVMCPDKFGERFAVPPDMYPCEPTKRDPRTEKPWTARATYCAEWEERQQDKRIVKREKLEEAKTAVNGLMLNEQIASLIDCSQKQVMAVAMYEDDETGLRVPLKILLDFVPSLESPFSKCLADLKTATSAALFPYTKAINEHGYHVQGALYLDVYRAATNEDRTDWLHAVQENYAPFQTATWLISSDFIEIGRRHYLDALKRYCQCLKTDVWPGYGGARGDWNGWGFIDPQPYMV